MKGITGKEYFCRVRKILKSKLKEGNIIAAINSRAVSIVRSIETALELMAAIIFPPFSFDFKIFVINWTKNELQEMDRIKKTPKLLTIYQSPLGRNLNRLFVTRKERGSGDSVQAEIERLTNFVDSSKGRVMEAIAQEKVLKRSEDFNNDIYGCCTSRTKKRVTREAPAG